MSPTHLKLVIRVRATKGFITSKAPTPTNIDNVSFYNKLF